MATSLCMSLPKVALMVTVARLEFGHRHDISCALPFRFSRPFANTGSSARLGYDDWSDEATRRPRMPRSPQSEKSLRLK